MQVFAWTAFPFRSIDVLHSSSNQPRARCNLYRDTQSEKSSNVRTKKRSNTSEDRAGQTFCYLTSNAKLSRFGALLYSSEDNDAVIKMMMNSRSPTMRQVSRTHRVALDWPFDRINLDPKIQNKDLDTKNQPADILTKAISPVRNGTTFSFCSTS